MTTILFIILSNIIVIRVHENRAGVISDMLSLATPV
jgi:hypothetical protein